MNARNTIIGLLQDWLRLTQTEARAIEACSWPDVRKAQDAKAALQPLLSVAMAEWTSACPPGQTPDIDPGLRDRINRLIAFEASNASLLAEQRRKAALRLKSLKDSRRNLSRVRNSYVPRPRLALDSYS